MIRRLGRKEGILSLPIPAVTYTLMAMAILYAMWPYFYYVKNQTIVVLGLFALWRYGWAVIHYVRSVVYSLLRYPRLQRQAMALPETERFPDRVFFVIPSYKEASWVTVEVFQSIFSNLSSIPSHATLIVATATDEEDALITALYDSHPVKDKVELVMQRQNQGKRTAMGHALRALARRYRVEESAVTVFMDGDSYLETDCLRKTLPFFAANSRLGALTTNEIAYINSRSNWYKAWFNLKFGQRHILFKSHALSNKLMTLTGRYSLFRTSIITEEAFIRQIEEDVLLHWMHGKFRFLMGDDKSSWFYLLKQGWDMIYVPDATVYSLESRDADFFQISTSLPYRWYGNTLRNNSRALALGWRKTGLFIWITILDQRLSMWTSLVGLTGALVLTLFKSFIYLPFYIAWVLLVRVLQMLVIAVRGHPVSLYTVPLMLYNQWVGAIIKIRASFNLADQSWSKGNANNADRPKDQAMIQHRLVRFMPQFSMTFAYTLFVSAILLAEGAVSLPDLDAIQPRQQATVIHVQRHGVLADDDLPDAIALNHLIATAPAERPLHLHLPPGRLLLDKPLIIQRDDVSLFGSEDGDTTLVGTFNSHSQAKGDQQALLWVQGDSRKLNLKLAADSGQDSSELALASAAPPPGWLLLRQPNSERFLNTLGAQQWNRQYPYVRQQIVRIAHGEGSRLWLEQPLLTDYTAADTNIWSYQPVTGFVMRRITLSLDIGITPEPLDFSNAQPDYAIDLLKLEQVAGCQLSDVRLMQAGRHALNLEQVYGCEFRQVHAEGAFNKGAGGNGYIRIARSFNNRFVDLNAWNLRHITFQWSAAHNRIERLSGNVDVNFHGGFSQHNRVDGFRFYEDEHRPWGAITRTPDYAHWAPPDGPGNEVTNLQRVAETAR